MFSLVLSSLFPSMIQIVHNFDDLDCLWSHDKATQVDAEKLTWKRKIITVGGNKATSSD
jgi:hypothetical protein